MPVSVFSLRVSSATAAVTSAATALPSILSAAFSEDNGASIIGEDPVLGAEAVRRPWNAGPFGIRETIGG